MSCTLTFVKINEEEYNKLINKIKKTENNENVIKNTIECLTQFYNNISIDRNDEGFYKVLEYLEDFTIKTIWVGDHGSVLININNIEIKKEIMITKEIDRFKYKDSRGVKMKNKELYNGEKI